MFLILKLSTDGCQPLYVQRNHRNARINDTPPQIASTSNRPDCDPSEAPSMIVALSASLSAVSGSALIKGCAIDGNLS